MLPPIDPVFLAMIQWHPRLSGVWCGVIVFAAAAWLFFLHRRLARRVSPGRARWLLLPKILTLLALLFVLFNPVSAMQITEPVKGKLLLLMDSSSSMDVADDYRWSRVTRARKIVESWKRALPAGIKIDELEFDTALHKPGENSPPGLRGTDLGGCLLALSQRDDMDSYLGVALLTDGGDEVLENPALPAAPLYIVGIGTDPAKWNDTEVAGVDCPPTAEKDVAFEVTADLEAHAGHGGHFTQQLRQVRVLLEHGTGTNSWKSIDNQTVDLSNLRRVVRFPVNCSEVGVQRYRVSIVPVAGELTLLNNARVVTVNVRKKSLHVLFFAEELGQEFKVLRNELAHDPGIAFTALFRTTGSRFELQGDRLTGDDALGRGFPATKNALEPYDAVILGSFPAMDFSPQQMQALVDFCQAGGTVIFLGGNDSFGRGGYADTPLAALLPWRISDREPEQALGAFPVSISPMGAGNPILATVEDIVARGSPTLDAVNEVDELKPGATALLEASVGDRDLPVVAMQRFGQGKVMAVASSTLWKWAMEPEPLGSAYGLLWRQAVRELTGKTEGGQDLAVRWDKDSYQPGEMAAGDIHALGAEAATLQFTATLAVKNQSAPVIVEPVAGQPQTFQIKLRFRERGDYDFRLAAFQGGRALETYEKDFPVAPLLPEGSRLEVDEPFLKKLAESGGGAYFAESDANQLPARLAKSNSRQVTEESSLAEASPWFLPAFLGVLMFEWILRRRLNLF